MPAEATPRQEQRGPLAAVAAGRLAQPVAGERRGDLVGLLAQQPGDDQRSGGARHQRRDVEQQRAHEVRDDGRRPRPLGAAQVARA